MKALRVSEIAFLIHLLCCEGKSQLVTVFPYVRKPGTLGVKAKRIAGLLVARSVKNLGFLVVAFTLAMPFFSVFVGLQVVT